ncbi:MAG: hypothetical protein WKF92_00830 [Pyrinomonadaceae bacterium]
MQTQTARFSEADGGAFALDTTFVLFFLAVDFGLSLLSFGIDGVFSAITLVMLLVLPYFLHSSEAKPEFGSWILGRLAIAALAVVLGVMFRQTLGVVLPESFKFLPLTLLIAAGMISCYIQFYSIMKFRLAR